MYVFDTTSRHPLSFKSSDPRKTALSVSPSHCHSSSTAATTPTTSAIEKAGHGPPIASTVILVQEKGALSTFRHVHAALRREWKGSNGGGTQSLREPDMNAHAVPVVGTPKLK